MWSERSLCIIANSSNVTTYEFPLCTERMTSTVPDPDMPQWAVKAPDYSEPAIENSEHSMKVNSFSKRPLMSLCFTFIDPVVLLLTM